MKRTYEIFTLEPGEVFEGGFFTLEAAEDYAWEHYRDKPHGVRQVG